MKQENDPRLTTILNLLSSLKIGDLNTKEMLLASGDELDKIIFGLQNITKEYELQNVVAQQSKIELIKSNRVQVILDKTSEISLTGTWELDLISSELIWNDLTKKIHEVDTDYEPNLGTGINFYVEGYSRDTITHLVNRAIKNGEQYDVELQIVTAKKNIKHVRSIGIPEKENGKVVKILGMFQDLTEQKNTEKENRKLAALIENSNEFIAISSMNEKIEFINEAGRKLVGIDKDAPLNDMNRKDYLTKEGLEVFQNTIMPAVLKYGSWSGENTLRHFITGDTIPVETSNFLIYDEITTDPIGLGETQKNITERKLQDQIIFSSKVDYENLVEQAKVLILKIDKFGIIRFTNSYCQQFFGYSKEEFIGSHVTETIVPPFDLQGNDLREMVNLAFTKPEEFGNNINENVCKNGEIKTISWINKPIYDDEGEFIEMLTVGNDLTEQNKTETEVQRLASIVQFSSDMVAIAEMNTEITFINETGRKLLGVESEELYQSSTMLDYFNEEGVIRMKEEIIPHVLKHGSWIGEIDLIHYTTKNSIPVSINLFLIYNNKGEPINFATHTRDISKEKKIRNQLIENEKNLKTAQKVGKVGSWELNLVNNKLYWSEEIYRILGLELFSVEADYEVFISFIHPDDRDLVNKAFANHIADCVEYNIVHRMVMTTGEIKYVQERCETERDSEGNAIRSIGTASDITEQKLIEIELEKYKNNLEKLVEERTQELEQTNEELSATNDQLKETLDQLKSTQSKLVQSEKMASLGVLTAGIAHEINNPINFVYGGINSLEENLIDVRKVLDAYEQVDATNAEIKIPEIQNLKLKLHFDKLMHFVSRSTMNIKKGAERTSEIIKGLKAFSRVDEDKLSLADIHESLDNSLMLFRSQHKDRIEIIKQYGNHSHIKCYPGKLSQVFVNIIANAIHAIKGEGSITVVTSKCKKNNKDFMEIKIADTGQGISDELINNIYEPFFTTKDVGEGTGLGLSISLGIIEDHKGFMEVDSKVEKGTTFSIYLPIID